MGKFMLGETTLSDYVTHYIGSHIQGQIQGINLGS